MREINGDGYKITYPNEIAFAFNMNRLKVEYAYDGDITFTVYKYVTNDAGGLDVVDSFSDKRVFYNDVVDIDISKYMQLCFDHGERHKTVSVAMDFDGIHEEINMTSVWGVLNIGETWNSVERVRMFVNYPQTFGIYVSEGATAQKREDGAYSDYAIGSGFVEMDLPTLFPNKKDSALRISGATTATSVYDETFDITFGSEDTATWYFDADTSDKGVYLRWVDRHGWLRYWLFVEGNTTESSKTEGEDLSVSFTDNKEMSHYGLARNNKNVGRSLKCCAVNLNDDERAMVASVAGSPYVDMWNGATWIPVRISDANLTDTHAGLIDYEIEVQLPNVITQTI